MLAQEADNQNRDVQPTVLTLLNNEVSQLEKLLEILEQEKVVLGGHDAGQLEAITSQKRTTLSEVENTSQKRIVYIRQLGIDPFSEGWFEQLKAYMGNSTTLSEKFDYLVSLTNRCRTLNQTNGLMIHRREALTSNVINILRANNTPEIYSDSGQSESRSDTRILGKA